MYSSTTLSFAIFLIVLICAESSTAGTPEWSRVLRPLDAELAQTLTQLHAVSPGARHLVDRLKRSNLLIHIVAMGPNRNGKLTGTTRFVVTTGGRRLLRITVDERLPADLRAAALAHELQHAVEVANAPAVVDHESFAALYRERGYESGGDPQAVCFDTPEAVRVGARVLEEFRTAVSDARQDRRAAVPANGSN
jgi:hypothetical protein